MPITITTGNPTAPADFIGWGQQVWLQSDFIGPLPTDAFWQIEVFTPEEINHVLLVRHGIASQANPTHLVIGDPETSFPTTLAGTQKNGGTVNVQAFLTHGQNGSSIDSGSTNIAWESTEAEPRVTAQLVAQTGAGFTSTDRQTIQQTQTTTEGITDALKVDLSAIGTAIETTVGAFLSPIKLEFNTQVSLSHGVTCDALDIDIGLSAFYGLVVHVTQIPEDWKFGTPDGDWGFHDLAVLSCWIGPDQLVRCGIHTPSFVLSPMPGSTLPFISPQTAQIQPPGYRVHLDWAPGVCGELLGVNLPG